jgi:hypothetical protein
MHCDLKFFGYFSDTLSTKGPIALGSRCAAVASEYDANQ